MTFPSFPQRTDNVDIVSATDINPLYVETEAIATGVPIPRYTTTQSATTDITLTDASMVVQSFTLSGNYNIYLPATSTDNHPFYLWNRTPSTDGYAATVKNSSSDVITALSPQNTMLVLPDGANGWTFIADRINGWQPQTQTWTYASADDPVYQIYVSGDVTANPNYKLGNKVKCTNNSTTFYGFIVKVGSYDAGNTRTPVDIYGGTDYDLANSAITAPSISKVKSPDGFPLSPAKWTVTATDTSDRSQASPTANVWYNLGSVSISIPIGVWQVSYSVAMYGDKASAATIQINTTLSTANNSESNASYTTGMAVVSATGVTFLSRMYPAILALTSKTTYYLNSRCQNGTYTSIYNFNSSTSSLVIKAICAYL